METKRNPSKPHVHQVLHSAQAATLGFHKRDGVCPSFARSGSERKRNGRDPLMWPRPCKRRYSGRSTDQQRDVQRLLDESRVDAQGFLKVKSPCWPWPSSPPLPAVWAGTSPSWTATRNLRGDRQMNGQCHTWQTPTFRGLRPPRCLVVTGAGSEAFAHCRLRVEVTRNSAAAAFEPTRATQEEPSQPMFLALCQTKLPIIHMFCQVSNSPSSNEMSPSRRAVRS